MDFFEKAHARARAQEILGLKGHPTQSEIRVAYKKQAFAKHPDRGEGTSDEFIQVNAAYALLKDDVGYTAADVQGAPPSDTGETSFSPNARRDQRDPARRGFGDAENYIAPRRVRTAMTSRIMKINQSEASECRSLLNEIPFMAEPEADEVSLRASILNVIKDTGTPHVPHTNHLPFAIRKTGRNISYMVNQTIQKGVNRVAVPTGALSDNRKVLPTIVRFNAVEDGEGTHVVSPATLASSFLGAKCVRIHFGLDGWP